MLREYGEGWLREFERVRHTNYQNYLMSWKGFTKALARTPQTLRSKFNVGEITKDPIYEDAGRRFKSLETEAKKLAEDAKKYTDAINGLLNHQIGFADACIEIYKPISGRASDPESYEQEGNAEGIEAAEAYKEIVYDLQKNLASEMDVINTRIVNPTGELLKIVKDVDKLLLKRDHKQLDYDRHRSSFKKLQEKKDKSLKDEKKLYEAETAFEQSSQEYEYYNEMLKEELPKLFALAQSFIAPLFQGFYYMQLNVYYVLYEKMSHCEIQYFDFNTDILESYERRRGDVKDRAEALTITKFKTAKPTYKRPGMGPGGKDATASSSSSFSSKREEAAAEPSSSTATDIPPPYSTPSVAGASDYSTPSAGYQTVQTTTTTTEAAAAQYPQAAFPPPPVMPQPAAAAVTTPVAAPVAAAAAAVPVPPPAPAPAAAPAAEHVVALYDYAAQAAGDLSFHAGDRIEVVSRTDNQNVST